MQPIRMIHPRHGAMHVYDEDQKLTHEKLGWKVEEPEVPAAVIEAEAPKRGRPRKAA